jgi:hypothetical protein
MEGKKRDTAGRENLFKEGFSTRDGTIGKGRS